MIEQKKYKISDLEILALRASITFSRPDWQQLYKLCHPETKSTNLAPIVSRWKNSPKISEYLQRLQEEHGALIEKAREEGRQEERGRNSEPGTRTDKNGADALIDYSDPQQQRRKLNELVNTAEDQKEALDALKTIIATQKDDREAARERKQIQSYLPMKCKSCPLYLAELKKLDSII